MTIEQFMMQDFVWKLPLDFIIGSGISTTTYFIWSLDAPLRIKSPLILFGLNIITSAIITLIVGWLL